MGEPQAQRCHQHTDGRDVPGSAIADDTLTQSQYRTDSRRQPDGQQADRCRFDNRQAKTKNQQRDRENATARACQRQYHANDRPQPTPSS